MSDALIPLDISDSPEILRLVEEMERSGVGRLLLRGSTQLAVMTLVTPQTVGSQGEQLVLDTHDPTLLFEIFGIGEADEPSDVEHHKDKYIADAIQPRSA